MEAFVTSSKFDPTAMYDRVLKDARLSFGHILADEVVVSTAREAVDEFLVVKRARVTTFVPVLAMRRVRETVSLLELQVDRSEAIPA